MSQEQDLLQTNNLGTKAKLLLFQGQTSLKPKKAASVGFLFEKGSQGPDPLFYKCFLCLFTGTSEEMYLYISFLSSPW